MTKALKAQISLEVVQKIAQRLQQVYGVEERVSLEEDFVSLSLMQRVHLLAEHFAHQLAQRLDLKQSVVYSEVVDQLPKVAHGLPDMAQFIFPQMIVIWGLKRPEVLRESLQGLKGLTELYTSELAMRQFIVEYGQRDERVWQQLLQWTQSENPHHRRLASESTRPRLPWAPHLSLTKDNPEKSLAILQPLWADSHPYVRKSVANHLNDHLKFNRDWVYKLLKSWVKNPSPATQWIVKHALRNELKAGEPNAYQILGLPSAEQFKIQHWQWQAAKIEMGWLLTLQGALTTNGDDHLLRLRLDWRLQWQTEQGKIRQKVFKGLEAEVPAGTRFVFNKKLKLRGQAYQGLEEVTQVQLQINGWAYGG